MKTVIMMTMLLASLLLLAGCNADAQTKLSCDGVTCNAALDTDLQNEKPAAVDKLEIYHFHGTNQCYSCKTVGAYAEETVNAYFADKLASGKIVFAHINVDLIENGELAKKYDVTSSSLMLGVYDDEGFHKEVNTNVWYKINNKEDYVNYLKGLIEKRLAGDMS